MKEENGYPLPLGVTVNKTKVNFSIAVESGSQCFLLLYRCGETTPIDKYELKEKRCVGNIRYVTLCIDEPTAYEYNYEIDGEISVDPYVKALAGRTKWGVKKDIAKHEIRGRICKDDFFWGEDLPLRIPYYEIIAYSLHVRGFTRHSSSGVRGKGTFRGIEEKIPYLCSLGVNQIQCMPVYEFEENQTYLNYWGYGEGFYFAPKASYAYTGDGITELKNLVKSCHKAGIEVVLEMPFADHTSYSMVQDALRYYVLDYHVDGFMINESLYNKEKIKADPVLAQTKMISKNDGFQSVMRKFLKGDEGMVRDVMYWLRHNSAEDEQMHYMANANGFTLMDVVSYDGKHNEKNGEGNQDGPDYNFSWNCGAEGPSRKKSVLNLRHHQLRNAFLLLLLAQGTPCILAGDEFGNSQNGNNNVYCQDNLTSWLDWRKLEKEKDLFEYVKQLISFRKKNSVFHEKKLLSGLDETACGVPDVSYHGESAWQVPCEIASRQLGIFYSGRKGEESSFFVAYNMHWITHPFALPALPRGKKWYRVIQTEDGILSKPLLLKNQREVVLKERTIQVFIGKE